MPPAPTNFTKRAKQLRQATQKWYRRVHAERKALGLTTRGTKRKLHLWPELHGLSLREQRRLRRRLLGRLRSDNGRLTIKGKPRKNYLWPELAALTGRERELTRMRLWYYRRVDVRARHTLGVLVNGSSHSALALQLKGAR